MLTLLLALVATAGAAPNGTNSVGPGAGFVRSNAIDAWKDTAGKPMHAHGGGVLLAPTDGRVYFYGESAKKDDGRSEGGVCAYSAPTLGGPWQSHGQVLSQADINLPVSMTGKMGGTRYVIERPKVLWNGFKKVYVMWFHIGAWCVVVVAWVPPASLLPLFPRRLAGAAHAHAHPPPTPPQT